MPQAKVLSGRSPTELRCPINFKTLEMTSSCDQYSISKIVQKTKSKTDKGELIINTELITEAIKAATKKHLINNKSGAETMSPVDEKNERDIYDLSTEKDGNAESVKTEDGERVESEPVNSNTEDLPATETDFELEPVRYDLLSVRRRSRQFYPVNEEPSEKENEEDALHKVPVFNLGRSLKNLYCKDAESQPEADKTDDDDADRTLSHPVEYDSDSGLLRKVQVYKPLRKIQSLPEMSNYSLEDDRSSFGFEPLGHSSSNTSSIKNLSKWNPQTRQMQNGPGYAFLASVVNNLRGKQSKAIARRVDTNVVKAEKNIIQGSESTESQGTEKTEPVPGRPSSAPSTNIDTVESKSKKSFFTSVYEWGTQTKSTVTNKEMNMYSPVTF